MGLMLFALSFPRVDISALSRSRRLEMQSYAMPQRNSIPFTQIVSSFTHSPFGRAVYYGPGRIERVPIFSTRRFVEQIMLSEVMTFIVSRKRAHHHHHQKNIPCNKKLSRFSKIANKSKLQCDHIGIREKIVSLLFCLTLP